MDTNQLEKLTRALQDLSDKLFEQTRYSTDVRPTSQYRIKLDLTNARTAVNPYKIGFPWKSIFVEDASDSLVEVRLSVHVNDQFNMDNYKVLNFNSQFKSQYQISAGFLTWDAQPGKSMTLILFTDIDFDSGRTISVASGGTAVVWGDSHVQTNPTITNTPSMILPADADRKGAYIQNYGAVSVYVGPTNLVTTGLPYSPSNTNKGIEIPVGASFWYASTGELWCVGFAGSQPINLNVFK